MFLKWFVEANTIFYPANQFWENSKSLFTAEPRSGFNHRPLIWTTQLGKPQMNTIYRSLLLQV